VLAQAKLRSSTIHCRVLGFRRNPITQFRLVRHVRHAQA
jgi:hypothetical protein